VVRRTCSGSSTTGGIVCGGRATERMPAQLPHCTATDVSWRSPPHDGTLTCTCEESRYLIVGSWPFATRACNVRRSSSFFFPAGWWRRSCTARSRAAPGGCPSTGGAPARTTWLSRLTQLVAERMQLRECATNYCPVLVSRTQGVSICRRQRGSA
jgi:hypothetical protein